MIDPLGLFYFGKRPLGDQQSGFIGKPEKPGSISDLTNTEVAHEHGFFEDGSGDNIGFRPSGRFSEDPTGKHYTYYPKHYDDAIMRQALKNITDGKYSLLWNNCQDWADRLREEYDRLMKQQNACSP